MKRTIEIEEIRAGQPRPYADSVYEDILTFMDGEGKWVLPLERVRKIAIAIYGDKKIKTNHENFGSLTMKR